MKRFERTEGGFVEGVVYAEGPAGVVLGQPGSTKFIYTKNWAGKVEYHSSGYDRGHWDPYFLSLVSGTPRPN